MVGHYSELFPFSYLILKESFFSKGELRTNTIVVDFGLTPVVLTLDLEKQPVKQVIEG